LASKFFPIEKQIDKLSDLLKYGNQYFLYSKSNLVSFNVVENEYWFLKKIYYDINAYLLPIILTIILIILIQLYRHQKRLVNELLALPNIGLLFVVDTNGRLININNSGREFLGMSANIPIGNFFRFYAKNNSAVPFADLIDRTLQNKDGINQKISIIIENNESEWFCKSIPLRNMTGMFRGVVLSAVDITEQLERKRLSNWAQLAHDMQTNLSTIKLNAEHLDIELSENNFSRQKRIIYQVNLLMQRVRDIVTVGRNENLILETHNVFDICHEVREEFDELMFPNIEFIIDVKPQLIACDKPKLIRALRNAAENGIKAMKGNPGTITFKAVHDKKFVSISVEDSGQGMDDDTKQKMLIPYFTTASKSGGSGIGTMIMQHVAELHGGYLTVESEKDKGTQVIFHIPNTLLNRRV
ncbi:MAG: HAMP domain-containing sensor histidine kinase, partial [Candidatus Kapaibacterium sp.]